MIKIWNEAFLKKQPENTIQLKTGKLSLLDYFPLALLAMASLLMGIFASTVFHYAMEAANQLTTPSIYIESVLNPTK
jgi:multicomponent Na+:H+ antiporter subunit D